MKKINRGDFWMLDADEAWSHVNAIQTELDRLERVGHGMVERIIRVEGRGGNSIEAHYQDGSSQVFDFVDGEWAPRPAPKTRERTNFEKIYSWTEWKKQKRKEAGYEDSSYYASQLLAEELVEGKTIDDLCRAAGISLKVTEE